MKTVKNLGICILWFLLIISTQAEEQMKEELDKVIEDDITVKLGEDLVQSLERKFQVDLERSVDMVLVKIKLLLQNGTMHIQDRLLELQTQLDSMKKKGENEFEVCLNEKQNETIALAEKALHQMVICGYALIGHDPSKAVGYVLSLKNMIQQELKPLREQKKDVYNLLKVCGHDHENLKEVIKCVMSKSPLIKSAMMEITSKLIEGVVELTKQMAHGAMHEACLIEVVKTVEDEAFELVYQIKTCVYGNSTLLEEAEKFIDENNATVIEVQNHLKDGTQMEDDKKDVKDMKELVRRMLSKNNLDLDKRLKNKLMNLHRDLDTINVNTISNNNFNNYE